MVFHTATTTQGTTTVMQVVQPAVSSCLGLGFSTAPPSPVQSSPGASRPPFGQLAQQGQLQLAPSSPLLPPSLLPRVRQELRADGERAGGLGGAKVQAQESGGDANVQDQPAEAQQRAPVPLSLPVAFVGFGAALGQAASVRSPGLRSPACTEAPASSRQYDLFVPPMVPDSGVVDVVRRLLDSPLWPRGTWARGCDGPGTVDAGGARLSSGIPPGLLPFGQPVLASLTATTTLAAASDTATTTLAVAPAAVPAVPAAGGGPVLPLPCKGSGAPSTKWCLLAIQPSSAQPPGPLHDPPATGRVAQGTPLHPGGGPGGATG